MSESESGFRQERELDSTDWSILALLQIDATLANNELASRVGVAPSTCLERVRRLRRTGVIASTRAHVDPSAVGRREQALLGIQIRPHARETAMEFVSTVSSFPETLATYNVAGVEDYLVHVAVRDSTALQNLILDRILVLDYVAHCRTQLIFGQPVISTIAPLLPASG